MYLILIGKKNLHALVQGPLHSYLRVIPHQATLIAGMIKVTAFVTEFCIVGHDIKAMGKVLRNEELFFIFLR